MIRTVLPIAVLALAAVATPTAAACKVRVPVSLSSSSEHAGPTVPCNVRDAAKAAKSTRVVPVDPLKLIRNRMLAGEDVSSEELQQLADSGDDLGLLYLAKRIEADNDPETLDTAAGYYLLAVQNGRTSAVRPLVRLLNTGALDASPDTLAASWTLLEKLAAENDQTARDALIAMYRVGKPFGLRPERAEQLLAASVAAGDGKAALDLAIALLTGTPGPEEIEEAKGYLKVAALSETLNIRTMAENLLRQLDPTLIASTETVQ